MPLYEYECPKCKKRIEVVESVEGYGAPVCGCSKTAMVRVEWSVPARVTPGKYGKGGGKRIAPPGGNDG